MIVSPNSSFLTVLSAIFAIPLSFHFLPILLNAVDMEPLSITFFGPTFDHHPKRRAFAITV